ncbi:uncharacterized protein L3040_009440 [Drepanopeziza brunnea f. sp. 'multigermtubi']|uniref:Uncharacterized protein n=1 Tax=Marssonina brunnea f. sp. multigermtubi (strain MB_m1) TaxID=1072389 RepID=K1WTD1_MARBU|nr:uncharacterized protein MBM_05620 [Drepanopeziza brunnea f. sp. 'multigermtubi' MB_m1]EKD16326.1 hypothetical protein MBM_05620 [Drepanopeziza brunnea f. sp. 'multigermtubi' MB_m1]KAJ5032849.1 hypothetical protein L3040_009440 [Drepanopeziza brunnea f. sp. 'multigermtubi']
MATQPQSLPVAVARNIAALIPEGEVKKRVPADLSAATLALEKLQGTDLAPGLKPPTVQTKLWRSVQDHGQGSVDLRTQQMRRRGAADRGPALYTSKAFERRGLLTDITQSGSCLQYACDLIIPNPGR